MSWEHAAFGSAQFGAYKVSDNVVGHRGIGVLKLAYLHNDASNNFLTSLLNMDHEDFPVVFEANAEHMLIEKAIYNSLINPLTAYFV